MTDLTDDYIKRVISAAPFADNEAGIPQMVELIKALHAQLADAKAAQAMAVERAAEAAKSYCDNRFLGSMPINPPPPAIFTWNEGDKLASAIRALADTDGLDLVQALQADAEAAVAKRNDSERVLAGMTIELELLAAANAALEAQVAHLVGLLRQHYDAQGEDLSPGKFNRLMSRTEAALAEVQADAQRKGDNA